MTATDRLIDETLRLEEVTAYQWVQNIDPMTLQSFRAAAPRLARMLEVAVKAMTAITAHPDCDVALVEIEKIAKGES